MPFHARSVEPARLRRPEAAGAEAEDAPLFRSLEQVSSHVLVCLLGQLADLSRCAGDIFGELEGQAAALGRRTAELHRRLDALHAATARLDHRRVKIPVSNLDEESRWTVHYTAPWHQQENVFLPTTRPPCVEDLHRQAKLNLKSVLRECDKLRRDGYRSSQYYSQGPTFSSHSSPLCDDYQDEDEELDQKCSVSSSEEERVISIRRPKTPTSSDFDLNTHTNWTRSLPLPTPEEKMRQQAQIVQADVVPINVTGENFDRQASLRRSLIYTDTLVRRPKKVKRRKTITGVPDNIQKELASGTGQEDVGGHSLYTPDHYSTLGRLDSVQSVGPRSETRDSSCQTEEVRVVPPSMRRIRAQKGQGIAAQMGHLSGSSGNMSVLSDSAGVVLPSRLNSDGFHSLPRPGARATFQAFEPRLGALGHAEDTTDGTFSCKRGPLQVDGTLEQATGVSRTLLRPRSQELRHFEGENGTSPACVVSPHATYSTSIIPNATLSSSSEVILIHTAHSSGPLDSRMNSSCSYAKLRPRDHRLSRHVVREGHQFPGGHWDKGHSTILSQAALDTSSPDAPTLSLCDSASSLTTPAHRENGSQPGGYTCGNSLSFPGHPQDVDGKSESSYAPSSSEPWEYPGAGSSAGSGRASPQKAPCATGSSTPASQLSSCSLDQPSPREDARPPCSVDHNGYHPAEHAGSGPGPAELCSDEGFGHPRHSVINVFDGRAQKTPGDGPHYQDKSLSRSISLKKAKKPPLPPSRTDSLRRVPKKGAQANGQVLSESLIATLQHSLQLNLQCKDGSSTSQSPCSDLEEPWLPRSRSQSTVSASSSMTSATTPNVYSLCGVTPSHSDTSSLKSEYTDPWGYYIDYTGVQDDPGAPGGTGAPGGGAAPGNGLARHGPDGSRTAMTPGPGPAVKPKITSPEKPHRVTSPSSGYSSQSNTPTALTPVPVFLKSASPANGKVKAKPKVPERKSSLISSVSVSSSDTSLSSNTSTEGSGAAKKLEAPLPLAPPLPNEPLADAPPLLPPPPPVADPSGGSQLPRSPVFPPPPLEVLAPFCSPSEACFPPPPRALSPLPPDARVSSPSPHHARPPSGPPPAPPLDPTLMKDARPCLRLPTQPDPWDAFKQPSNREENARPLLPLITTEALQTVQLRPVRKSSGTQGAPQADRVSQEKPPPVGAQYPLKPSAFLKARNSINEMGSQSQNASATGSLPAPAKSAGQGHHDGAVERGGLESRRDGLESRRDGLESRRDGPPAPRPGASPQRARAQPGLPELPASPTEPPSSSPARKPPPISKKPKLFLVVPPPQRELPAERTDSLSAASRDTHGPAHGQEAEEGAAAGAGSRPHEPDGGSLAPEEGPAASTAPGRVEADAPMVQPDASPAPKQEEPGSWDEGSSTDSSAEGVGGGERCPTREDGEAGVLESDVAAPSSEAWDFLKEEGGDEVMAPSRPRTTEDLFAAIHRSKRKVLGRKDSDDDHTRNHSPSPPVTPTGAAPSLTSPRQVGSIQRSVRKSSTSSDNFKALLLKKGSRSDTSARMSAAEMLKSTDPRFHRSRSESSADAPESPSSCSPNKNRRAQEEWAKNEGLMPRSLSFSGPRYGRSRTPPSAASSRYSVRNRIQSSPMTVISEGEGEAGEPVDSRARRALGAARAGSLDGVGGSDGDEGSLLRGEQPATSVGAEVPLGPADRSAGPEDRDPHLGQCGGSREET